MTDISSCDERNVDLVILLFQIAIELKVDKTES